MAMVTRCAPHRTFLTAAQHTMSDARPATTFRIYMCNTLQSSIDAAMVDRTSIRAFLPDSISKDTITDILKVASRAPSGTNTQPWQVYVLSGEIKTSLSKKVRSVRDDVFQN